MMARLRIQSVVVGIDALGDMEFGHEMQKLWTGDQPMGQGMSMVSDLHAGVRLCECDQLGKHGSGYDDWRRIGRGRRMELVSS